MIIKELKPTAGVLYCSSNRDGFAENHQQNETQANKGILPCSPSRPQGEVQYCALGTF
jgi:hypothetical protein